MDRSGNIEFATTELVFLTYLFDNLVRLNLGVQFVARNVVQNSDGTLRLYVLYKLTEIFKGISAICANRHHHVFCLHVRQFPLDAFKDIVNGTTSSSAGDSRSFDTKGLRNGRSGDIGIENGGAVTVNNSLLTDFLIVYNIKKNIKYFNTKIEIILRRFILFHCLSKEFLSKNFSKSR